MSVERLVQVRLLQQRLRSLTCKLAASRAASLEAPGSGQSEHLYAPTLMQGRRLADQL